MSASSQFQVSMILRAYNQMTPALNQVMRSVKQLQGVMNQTQKQSNSGGWFDKAITGVDKLQSKVKSLKSSMSSLVKSGEHDIFSGALMAAPLVAMVKSAAAVNRTQMTMMNAGLSQAQVNTLTSQAQQTMRKTMFNTGQVLGVDLSLRGVGMNYAKIKNVSQTATYLAELEANRNGADPNTTAKQFAQMAEQLQISMNPQKVKQLADMINRISTVTSASVATLSDSSRYFNLVGKIQGLSASDIMMTQGLAARYGLEGSIGGTNLKDFFERLNPQLHMGTMMGKPIVNAFASMGWLKGVKDDKKGNVASISGDVFHDKNGNLVSAQRIFSIIAQTYQKMGNKERFNALMTRIFGQQGQAIAAAVGQNPQAFAYLQQQMAAVPTVNKQISNYQKTPWQQWNAFVSTLQDFGRQIGTMVLPSITRYLTQLNGQLPKVQQFIDKNKSLIKTLVEVWAGLAAFKVGSGVAKIAIGAPLKEVFGAIGMGAGVVKGGFRVGRGFYNTAKTYSEFRKLGAGRMMSLWAGVEALHPNIKRTGHAVQKGWGFLSDAASLTSLKGQVHLKLMGTRIKEFSSVWGGKALSGLKSAGAALKNLGSSALGVAKAFAGMSLKAVVATAKFIANGVATVALKTAQLAVAAATRTWAAVQWLVNAAMTANPIGLIVVGIGALIGVIVLLVTHWKQVITWLKAVWTWYQNLGDKVKWAIAIFMPFIGIPALIISKWSSIMGFFDGLWKHISPVLNGIGKFFGIGGGSSTPVLVGSKGGGNAPVTIQNNYNIKSTNPKQAANEVARKQKYVQSRDPRLAYAGGR